MRFILNVASKQKDLTFTHIKKEKLLENSEKLLNTDRIFHIFPSHKCIHHQCLFYKKNFFLTVILTYIQNRTFVSHVHTLSIFNSYLTQKIKIERKSIPFIHLCK